MIHTLKVVVHILFVVKSIFPNDLEPMPNCN